MDSFATRGNIKRYRRLAGESMDSAVPAKITRLLAGQEAKFKLKASRRDGAPERRGPSTGQLGIGSNMTKRGSAAAVSRKAADPPANRLLGLLPPSDYVQVPGAGLRMKASLFKKTLARSASMRTVMLHYAHAFFNQVAQSAACNQFHSIEQRCCRWMLMTHDRMQSDEFLLTQEFLAMMLGVQRTGVTAAAGALQRAGLIRYTRGNVTIIDRRGLVRRSCECYDVSKKEFDRLLGERTMRKARAMTFRVRHPNRNVRQK
jgi:Crp-like helix-turn-helix protein